MKSIGLFLLGMLAGILVTAALLGRYTVIPGNVYHNDKQHGCFIRLDRLTGQSRLLGDDAIDAAWQ